MDQSTLQIALVVSVLAMILSIRLAVNIFFKNRALSELEEEELQEELLDQSQGMRLSRFNQLADMMKPKDQDELNALKKDLTLAGFRKDEELDLYNSARSVLMVLGILVLMLTLVLQGIEGDALLYSLVFTILAFFAPKWWLNTKIKARQESIALSLPPTLDLLVTCMEAGLNLDQAIDRVSREIEESDPELADELIVTIKELNAGLSLSAAFRKLSERVSSDDIKNLCNAIIQSASLGASLGRAMREYAAAARRRRELSLEESAGKVTAGLTLPLTLCLLPSAMLSMLAPAVVSIVQTIFS
jgi:tight adherence protein C